MQSARFVSSHLRSSFVATTLSTSSAQLISAPVSARGPFGVYDSSMVNFITQTRPYATLPRLPVPPLKQTLGRFLAVVKPIVSPEEYDKTGKLAYEFSASDGQGTKLQSLLEQHAMTKENWLTDWWLQKAYLELRMPVVINVSPALMFPPQKFCFLDGQIKFASRFIVALMHYRDKIIHNKLPPEMSGGQPLDMSQHKLLFGTVRNPGKGVDRLRFEDPRNRANHIVIAYHNEFYRFQVLDSAGQMLNADQIHGQLSRLFAQVGHPVPTSRAVGILSADDRDRWAAARERLRSASDANQANLDAIETSLFVLCLDQPVHGDAVGRDPDSTTALQCLHGGGSEHNSGNRWFDKCLQFVIGADGGCGMTYEHSPAEGPAVAMLMDNVMDYLDNQSVDSFAPAQGETSVPETLKFDLTPEIEQNISEAAKEHDKAASDVDGVILHFSHFGKSVPKQHKISPDSFFQLAMQLAYNRVHNRSPPTYETGTLRSFHLGRTDTIRLPLAASDAFVSAMISQDASAQQKVAKMRLAATAHKEYTVAACTGNGIDRHLLGLKIIAQEHQMPIPDILKSKAYETALHFQLSTSQVPTRHDACMLFGPMYNDCYGVCYNPQENRYTVGISSYKSCADVNLDKFADALEMSLLDMRDALEAAPSSKL